MIDTRRAEHFLTVYMAVNANPNVGSEQSIGTPFKVNRWKCDPSKKT
jgi:hypothetical protein